jgi:hypothetical protein
MKPVLTLAFGALSLLAAPLASADPVPVEPGLHVERAAAARGRLASPGVSGEAASPPTMAPAEMALLFAGLAAVNALVARRRCIAARLAARSGLMTRAEAP